MSILQLDGKIEEEKSTGNKPTANPKHKEHWINSNLIMGTNVDIDKRVHPRILKVEMWKKEKSEICTSSVGYCGKEQEITSKMMSSCT